MTARFRAQAASSSDGEGGEDGAGSAAGPAGDALLTALLDDMETALCAFDADGVVTHWNREAERVLGWSATDAVGRRGFAGWALRAQDAAEVEGKLFGAMRAAAERQVAEFALLTKDGGRVLVRTQSSAVPGADGRPAGLYCAFSEVHAQVGLERSLALSEALFDDAAWGVVLVDADLRPAALNLHAAEALRSSRTAVLGQPLGELIDQGLEELEGALQHVLAEGAPPAPAELWLTLRQDGPDGGEGPAPGRRCWRCGFVRLASPLGEEAVPLGVAWLFQDITGAKLADQEAARLRFRDNQLNRAARAAGECTEPMEAATVHLDFALAGFADHALLDLAVEQPSAARAADGRDGPPGSGLVRAVVTPAAAPGPVPPVEPGLASGIPVGYREDHPALQAYERCGSVRASVRTGAAGAGGWAEERKWPPGTVHGLCAVLRSGGRTLGVATFLRGSSRRPFDRSDAAYAEDVAVRVAAAVDLARSRRAPGGQAR